MGFIQLNPGHLKERGEEREIIINTDLIDCVEKNLDDDEYEYLIRFTENTHRKTIQLTEKGYNRMRVSLVTEL